MSELRALTVRQPWCEAIADGHKRVENRSQGFPKRHRGPVLIHAALGWSVRGQRDSRVRAAYGLEHRVDLGTFDAMSRGTVLAIVELVDVHPAAGCCAPWGEETYPPASPEQRPPGRVTHLVLEDALRLRKPIRARGALGLWRPDDDLVLEVCHALADVIWWDKAAARRVAERGDFAQLWSLVRDEAA